jgi:hypothetical protein
VGQDGIGYEEQHNTSVDTLGYTDEELSLVEQQVKLTWLIQLRILQTTLLWDVLQRERGTTRGQGSGVKGYRGAWETHLVKYSHGQHGERGVDDVIESDEVLIIYCLRERVRERERRMKRVMERGRERKMERERGMERERDGKRERERKKRERQRVGGR